ncbi:Kelch repeat-containing protein [Mucilaginibacter ginkgonis]|uniref:Galactose oxidase n=1 Tax=Mucilaginibacter ginkgonis TaxID=2682091 RepID=A0A7T7FBG1_9SPHI|nr:galactose oxidase [Mucilaginibacter ginkgonis]QQL50296.1 galactose oxidase [Mucilaginibacter ginkgonis]
MRNAAVYISILFTMLSVTSTAQHKVSAVKLQWSQLAQIPDKYGFAGSFAGVSNNCLIVAGGANFPDGGAPWTGSKKVWTDKVFILDSPNGQWKEAGTLPMPLGYGVSVSYHNQLICFGGSNADGHYNKVFGISYHNGEVKITNYPDMPAPLANSAGVLVGSTVYIAGGLSAPADTHAANNFWSLDLSKPAAEQKWRALENIPGEPRMLSTAGAAGGKIFVFSGTALHPAADGSAKREYLIDAYAFAPGHGWQKVADLPYPAVATAGPAYTAGNNTLFVFGGDDGSLADKASELKDRHTGFSNQILAYNLAENTWMVQGQIFTDKKDDAVTHPNNSTWAPVTTSMVIWHNQLIFPGGEVRPGTRTPRVLAATVTK